MQISGISSSSTSSHPSTSFHSITFTNPINHAHPFGLSNYKFIPNCVGYFQ
jgi:hypothetical protein